MNSTLRFVSSLYSWLKNTSSIFSSPNQLGCWGIHKQGSSKNFTCIKGYYHCYNITSFYVKTGNHFRNNSWDHATNLVKMTWYCMKSIGHIKVKFAHVMTAGLSWQVKDCNLIMTIKIRAKRIFIRFQLWTHKPLLKWVPDNTFHYKQLDPEPSI